MSQRESLFSLFFLQNSALGEGVCQELAADFPAADAECDRRRSFPSRNIVMQMLKAFWSRARDRFAKGKAKAQVYGD